MTLRLRGATGMQPSDKLTGSILSFTTMPRMAVRFVQTLCTAAVILLLLARETVSYLLFHFPAESLLWQLSLGLGYGFHPLQSAADAYLGGGFAGRALLLTALLSLTWYAYARDRRLAAAVMCHGAFFCLFLVLLMSAPSAPLVSAYSAEHGLAPRIAALSVVVTQAGNYGPLLSLLFLGCVLSHIEYFRTARRGVKQPSSRP